jgi:hypothetical protein
VVSGREGSLTRGARRAAIPSAAILLGLGVIATSIPASRLHLGLTAIVQTYMKYAAALLLLISSTVGLVDHALNRRGVSARVAELRDRREMILNIAAFWAGVGIIVAGNGILHATVLAGLGGALACWGVSQLAEPIEGIMSVFALLLVLTPFGGYFLISGIWTLVTGGPGDVALGNIAICLTAAFFYIRHLGNI